MFKRFTVEDGLSGQNLVKSSVQRGIRGALGRARRASSASTAAGREPLLALSAASFFARGAGRIAEQYPSLEEGGVLEVLLPKKDKMVVGKWCARAATGARSGSRRSRGRRLRASWGAPVRPARGAAQGLRPGGQPHRRATR